MFDRSLSESLKFVQDQKDQQAVLAFLANEQLCYFSTLPPNNMHAFLDKHVKLNAKTISNAVANDRNNNHPILFCYLALITDDINRLDADKLDYTIGWLEEKVENQPAYQAILNNLISIENVRHYALGERVKLKEGYLNLSRAILPHADVSGYDLCNVNLTNAELECANLENTTLNGTTILTHANVKGANFTGADLRYANLASGTLNLQGIILTDAKMSAQTCFFHDRGRLSEKEYNKYLIEKKTMLTSATFVSNEQLMDGDKLDKALSRLYLMLEDNKHFPLLQECIGHDLIVKAQQQLANTALSELCDQVYAHPMFEHDNVVAQAANLLVNSVHSLFADNTRRQQDVIVIESNIQSQIRVALGK